jgi:hypothetical protein
MADDEKVTPEVEEPTPEVPVTEPDAEEPTV